ncbi:MAG: RDD family protein [Pseudarcicella sp.]|nr:RDD family protein [Pseudarcicella sp.]MBP6410962.1 RDD family protein [Pseudarcicella sp.]
MSNFNFLDSQNNNSQLQSASLGDRLVAGLIDHAIVVILGSIFYFFYIISYVNNNLGFSFNSLVVICTLTPFVFYSFLFEYFNDGQSIGKLALKIKVLKIDGSKPSAGALLMRWFFRIFEIFLTTGILALIVLSISKKSQRLGDMVAGTIVVTLKSTTSIHNLRS